MLTLVVASLLGAIGSARSFASAAELLDQKVLVGGVTATVRVLPYPFIRNDFLIEAEFKSSTYPVGCLSDYDLSYQLRATDGRVIPVNRQALKGPAQEVKVISNPAALRDCTKYTNDGTRRILSVFSKLYPNVPSGSYALHISFIPHGTGQNADFQPVPISIEPCSPFGCNGLRYGSLGSAAELLDQRLVVGGIAATVSVINPGNGITVQAVFQSSIYPVGCLSVYRDLRYELRASDGRLISVNQDTVQNQPYEGPQTLNHIISSSSRPAVGCAANAVNGVWRAHALFTALYPNLPQGSYTLHISFVPRGTGQHADFAPVHISIEPLPHGT